MAKARAIIKRRKAVKNTAKITKTMNMIASSRFQRALKRAVAARPYTDKLKELLADLSGADLDSPHPLLQTRSPEKKTLVLVITANRGLCGGYNANVLREATQIVRAEIAAGRQVLADVAGKRGLSWAKFNGHAVRKGYTQFDDRPKFDDVEPIAKAYIEGFLAGEWDRVFVVYMKFISAGRQSPVTVQVLPLQAEAAKPAAGSAAAPAKAAAKTAGGYRLNYEFLPDAAGILDELIPQSIKATLFQGFLDAAVSEQVARMVAMKNATDNANDLVRMLTSSANRARQTQITTELSEIMSGAEALKG